MNDDFLQTAITNAVKSSRNERMKTSSQLTVGELLIKLEAIPNDQKEERQVIFAFEYAFPTGLASWRGNYYELAFTFDFPKYDSEKGSYTQAPTLSEVISWLKDCIGKQYTGYKGGEFIMEENTPLWVANYGNSGNTGVVDISFDDYEVVLKTDIFEY